ncbi:unnamed protein product, partial [Iphiclides podalirius]
MWAPATRMFLNTEQIESVVQVHATTPLCVSLGPEHAIEEVGLLSLLKPSEQGVMRRTPCAVSLLYATAAGCAECTPSPPASRAGRSIGASDVRERGILYGPALSWSAQRYP